MPAGFLAALPLQAVSHGVGRPLLVARLGAVSSDVPSVSGTLGAAVLSGFPCVSWHCCSPLRSGFPFFDGDAQDLTVAGRGQDLDSSQVLTDPLFVLKGHNPCRVRHETQAVQGFRERHADRPGPSE
jgi:hypothetical protein